MFQIAFALFITIQSQGQAAPQDEIGDALAHAEALYYGARFNDSIALLTRVDGTLKTQQGRLQEKLTTKLRLALAYIGTNETSKAKAALMDLYALDSDYALDARQFSPKVMAIADEAKAEQNRALCQTAQQDAKTFLDEGKTTAFLDLLRSKRSKCAGLAAIGPEAAESLYRAGVAAYRHGDVSSAQTDFEGAVTLSPEHELALQYLDLINSKQQVNQDRMLLQWQRDFD